VKKRSHLAKTREVGWREWIALPEFGIEQLKAKLDTGARTSALHAVDIETYTDGGDRHVAFRIPLGEPDDWKRCTAVVLDEREIKNTSGRAERRLIIGTTLIMGRRRWHIEFSLADRKEMEFETILGRTALRRHGFLVNPGRSFLLGLPVGRSAKKRARSTKRQPVPVAPSNRRPT